MRLKSAPGDFRVDEVLSFDEDPHGKHYVHRLEKRKLDTPRALALVARLAGVTRGAISYAGLKDRQGVTSQWISIEGRSIDHDGDGIRLRYVGRSPQPIDSRMSTGNRFTIVVRDLGRRELDSFERNQEAIDRFGFANYFDDQRFGCLRHGQGFVMQDVLRGRYDRALEKLVATPSPIAIAGGDVKLKRSLARVWGDWDACGRIARGPIWRRMFTHLQQHPTDFESALGMLPTRTLLIHAFAFQSLVWNRSIDSWLYKGLPKSARLPLSTIAGRIVSWRHLAGAEFDVVADAYTPLFGPDDLVEFERRADSDFVEATYHVLDDLQLSAEAFAVHRVPGMLWQEEDRRLLVRPKGMRTQGPEADELHRGQKKLTLRFGLPRGAYATMLMKHLFAGS